MIRHACLRQSWEDGAEPISGRAAPLVRCWDCQVLIYSDEGQVEPSVSRAEFVGRVVFRYIPKPECRGIRAGAERLAVSKENCPVARRLRAARMG
jgi:hypothetical protein